MDYSFLVDVNLPKYFSFFNDSNYTFVSDLNLQMTDTEIWDYALKNNLIILTKDVDFFNRFVVSDVAPKIIYFQLGNFSLKQMFHYFEENWIKIQSEIKNARLIIAKDTHIECIH
jgi:predicted nuclease of predicted toxin-antitoxin system